MTRAPAEDGFALPLVMSALALLALSLSVATFGVDDLGRAIDRARSETTLESEAFSGEARFAHLLLTEPIDHRGLRVGGARLNANGAFSGARGGGYVALPFDGRAFTSGALTVSVQDEAGLINVNAGDDAMVARALTAVQVSGGAARRLAAALTDYVDADDLRRMQGAEKRDYRAKGLADPANAPLRHESGATQALGWRDAIGPTERRRFLELAAALPPEQRFNLNTAPPAALAAATGLEPRAVERIMAARETEGLSSTGDIAALTGVRLAGGVVGLGGLPARQLRFTAWRADAHRPLAYRSHIRFGDDADDRPVRITPGPLMPMIPTLERSNSRDERRPLPARPLVFAARDG